MELLDPVNQLEMRAEFITGIVEVAQLCNWTQSQVEDLRRHLLEELAYIDNLMYDTYDRTSNREVAYVTWEAHMEDLRRWLSLIFGIKIKYV